MKRGYAEDRFPHFSIGGEGDGFVCGRIAAFEILADLVCAFDLDIEILCPGPPSLFGRCNAIGRFEVRSTDPESQNRYICERHIEEWRQDDNSCQVRDLLAERAERDGTKP